MLPEERLYRTNFIDGIKFNPEQISVNEDYFNAKLGLMGIYGIGRGVLVGYLGNLELLVENNQLIIRAGAAIDSKGNMIFLENNYMLLQDILVAQFENRFDIFIYISHESQMDDLKPSKYDNDLKIYYKINEKSKIILSQKRLRDTALIELGRVYIAHQQAQKIEKPSNPYAPKKNEINLNYVPKIISENTFLKYEEVQNIADVMDKYGAFLHEFGLRKSIYSMATIASYSLSIASSIKGSTQNTPWQIYEMLKKLLDMSLKIYIERSDIGHTALWKNIVRLESIFSFNERLKIEYYNMFLDNESSFFSKIILHFNNAVIFDGDWDNILVEQKEEVIIKDYIIIGSDSSCDMLVLGEDVAKQHAKIYLYETGYFIEDLEGSSGVYVNAMRVERGMKKFIRKQDYVVLGKNGKVLNLQNIPL
jgi:hypothetical protein